MIRYLLIIFFIFLSVKAIAYTSIATGFDYVMPAPPKSSDTQSLYSYLYQIYSNWGTIQVTNTEPNGNINVSYGNICIYFDGTNYWLAIQTSAPSGSTWVGTKLGSV